MKRKQKPLSLCRDVKTKQQIFREVSIYKVSSCRIAKWQSEYKQFMKDKNET